MDEFLQTAVERLTRELRADPYRPDCLVERLLLYALLGNLAGLQSDLAILKRFGIARSLLPMMVRLESGAAHIMMEQGIYLVVDASAEPETVQAFSRRLHEVQQEAERFFGPLAERVVVELSSGPAGLYHASREVPGVGYLRLSPRNAAEDVSPVLAHELAHLYLSCGNRFLDEGVAILFQAHCHGDPVLPGLDFDTESDHRILPDQPLSLRALLAYDGRNDVFFDRLTPDARHKRVVYGSGLAFARHLLSRLQMDGVKALFARLRAASSSAAHPSLVAEALGESIEAVDRRLFQRSELPPTGFSVSAHGCILPSTTVIWAELSPDDLNGLIERLRCPTEDENLRGAVQACLARALVRRLLEEQSELPRADLSELRSLVYEARTSACLPDRERTLLEGWLAIAELRFAPSVPARIVSWEKALSVFRHALERFPDDPEVLCATAALHLRGPVDYGANRALARECLSKVTALDGWTLVASSLARELREETA